MATTIQNRKIEFIQNFLKVTDVSLLSSFEAMLLKARNEELNKQASTPFTKKH